MAVFYSEKEKELVVTCRDACGEAAHIKVNTDDCDYYALWSYMNGNFYKEQNGVFRTFANKVKKIWAIIRNKDYCYSDIVMDKEEFETFKKYINQF